MVTYNEQAVKIIKTTFSTDKHNNAQNKSHEVHDTQTINGTQAISTGSTTPIKEIHKL